MPENPAEIEWRDGDVPVASRFDDPYFSLENGLAETRHVFHAGNGLPERFRDGFRVAELGFGTGLNCLATLMAWRAAGVPGTLHYTAFEAFPMPVEAMERALAAFPELGDLSGELLAQWRTDGAPIRLEGMELTLILGDARATLPAWAEAADAWFLDGFSPAKNPEMWGPALMGEVARHMAPGGTLATYTAAGDVRRALAASGVGVERVPGYGRKRHMTKGTRIW